MKGKEIYEKALQFRALDYRREYPGQDSNLWPTD